MSTIQYPVAFPQGVADADAEAGFVARRAGGISAIDLAHGKLLWTTAEPAWPLLVLDGRLLAYRALAPNALEVVAAATAGEGTLTRVCEPVQFPEWVNVNPRDNSEFSLAPTAEDRFLFLAWDAHARYRGGAAPSRQVLQAAKKNAAGTVRIDLDTGKATLLPPRPAPPAIASLPTTSIGSAEKDRSGPNYRIGAAIYALVQEALGESPRRSILKKWQAASGKLIWQLVLEEWRPSRAPPRRP